jgi:hypothetical protein
METVKIKTTDGRRLIIKCDNWLLARHSRNVYTIDDIVIKLDYENQNEDEFDCWKNVRRSDKKFFAPVIGYAGISTVNENFSVLIQKKIKGRKTNSRFFVQWARAIADKVGLTDLEEFHNFVVVTDKNGNSHPVIYDMGL